MDMVKQIKDVGVLTKDRQKQTVMEKTIKLFNQNSYDVYLTLVCNTIIVIPSNGKVLNIPLFKVDLKRLPTNIIVM